MSTLCIKESLGALLMTSLSQKVLLLIVVTHLASFIVFRLMMTEHILCNHLVLTRNLLSQVTR